jgi:aldehyde dehydrogenase (NAD+)
MPADAPIEVLPPPCMLIGSRTPREASGGSYQHIYAATGRPTVSIPLAGTAEVHDAVTSAREAFPAWQEVTLSERHALLLRLARAIRENSAKLSTIQTIESGVPRRHADAMPELAAKHIEHCASWIDKIPGAVLSTGPTPAFDYTQRYPYGVIGMIVTWNAALPSLGQLLGAALATGNTVVIKASELAPFTAFRLAQLTIDCGFPPGVVNILAGGATAGAALVRHPDVDKLHFTGSARTARAVLADAAENITPACLELGGKSALIIFEDAEVGAVAQQALSGAVVLSGQGCANSTRVLIHASLYDQVLRLLRGYARRVPVGDPLRESTVMGPLISASACDRVLNVIERARSSGSAELLAGGERLNGELADGYFIAPTLFGNVERTSELAQEEIFGPVLCFSRFETEEEAIALANSTRYGLAAYVHTHDLRRAHRVSARLNAGNVWINGMEATPPSVPFGGMKLSGHGRLGGLEGILEFTYTKNTWIHL